MSSTSPVSGKDTFLYSGRNIHNDALASGFTKYTNFTTFFRHSFKELKFEENIDYVCCKIDFTAKKDKESLIANSNSQSKKGRGGDRKSIDYLFTDEAYKSLKTWFNTPNNISKQKVKEISKAMIRKSFSHTENEKKISLENLASYDKQINKLMSTLKLSSGTIMNIHKNKSEDIKDTLTNKLTFINLKVKDPSVKTKDFDWKKSGFNSLEYKAQTLALNDAKKKLNN